MKKIILAFIIGILILPIFSKPTHAAFGVSPADISFDYLSPGMTVTDEFLISRTNTEKVTDVIVQPDVEEVEKWISVDPGLSFTIPAGVRTQKMKVTVIVPKDAPLKEYKGYLNLKFADGGKNVGVSIIQGVAIAINLTVTNSKIAKLFVKNLEIPITIKSGPIKLVITTQNRGNESAAPDKAIVVIKDINGKKLYQSEDDTLEAVEPGKEKDIIAEFNNQLAKGDYFADTNIIFKGESIKQEKLKFSVTNAGKNSSGNFFDLVNYNWLILYAIVTLSIIPTTIIWAVLRKKYYD